MKLLKFYQKIFDAYQKGVSVEQLKRLLGRGRAKEGMFEGDLDKLIAKQQETATQASRRDSREARKEPDPLPDVVSEDENDKESEE